MRLEDQVCSLELAKRLKDLGVKQESFFYWTELSDGAKLGYLNREFWEKEPGFVATWTVAELGEMLRSGIVSGWHCNSVFICYDSAQLFNKVFSDKNEADARAQMLIYLLESKLIPSSEGAR